MIFKKLSNRLNHELDCSQMTVEQLKAALFDCKQALANEQKAHKQSMATALETISHMQLINTRLNNTNKALLQEFDHSCFPTHGGKPHANVDLPQFLRKQNDGEEGQHMAKQAR